MHLLRAGVRCSGIRQARLSGPRSAHSVRCRTVATGVGRGVSGIASHVSEGAGTAESCSSAVSGLGAAHVSGRSASFLPVEVQRPNTDYRQYRVAQLPNQLLALVVSDPKCDRAAAALSVQVGSLSDPSEIQGLAHFCEHMLFLGTEKFPEENEYNTYLAKNGGSSNAYTAESVTNYYFGVKPEALDGALDRFAQFFISPLFTESATERELLAVDSEHSKNLQNDGWRQQQLLRGSVNPAHPLHHFMTGNSTTLRDDPARDGVDVRSALLDFVAKYYSANVMSVVIVGREEPEELLAMAQTHFSAIVNRDAKIPQDAEIGKGIEAFPPECKSRIVHVVPVNDVRTASFQFVVPGQKENWRPKPARYISHLIGHEGAGSLLTALKHRGLATELSAGESLDEAGIGMLSVNVVLTEHGEANIETVGKLVFAYIRLLRQNGPKEYIFQEMQQLGDMSFRFRSLVDSMSTASSLSHSLRDFPLEFMLSAGARIWDYEPSKIEELLAKLTTANLRLVLSSKSYADKCTSKEKWYGTRYIDEALEAELCSNWDNAERVPDLALPPPNPFVPKDLELRPSEGSSHPAVPKLLALPFDIGGMPADRVATAYFRKDEQFGLPKAVCAFQLYCPFARESVAHCNLAELWCRAVTEELNEYSYDASAAGLNYALQSTSWGLIVTFSGYNDKLPALLEAVAKKMAGLSEVSQDTFEIVHRVLERDLANAASNSSPHHQAYGMESRLLGLPASSFEERLAAVRAVDGRAALSGVGSKLLQHCHVECILQGNLTAKEASGLVESFLQPLGIERPLDALPSRGVAVLPSGWTQLERQGTNAEERNGAALVTLQVSDESVRSRCLMDLAAQVLGQRFFDELRTKQQLGYIVSASGYGDRGCFVGLRMVVQTERPLNEVVQRIRDWFAGACDSLEKELSQDEFNEYRAAHLSKLRERPKSLGEEFGRNWAEVASRGFEFTRREELATQVEALTLQDLQQFVAESLRSAPAACFLVEPAGAVKTPPAQDAFLPDRALTLEDVPNFRETASWRLRDSSLRKEPAKGGLASHSKL